MLKTLILILSVVIVAVSTSNTKFVTEVNPGCGELCSNGTLLAYSRLRRQRDSLHVLLAVGDGFGDMTVTYIQSSKPDQLISIAWDKVFSDDPSERLEAINFTYPASATTLSKFSVAFTNLIEYADTKDTVDPANASNFTVHQLGDFHWKANFTEVSGDAYSLTLYTESLTSGNSSQVFLPGGSLQFSLLLSANKGRAGRLPQLQFTGNSSQLEVLLDRLRSNYPSSRFAIEASMLADGAVAQKLQPIASIDDEFTPGIFHVNDWLASGRANTPLSYIQWKPVCYKTQSRSLTDSSVVHSSDKLAAPTTELLVALNDSFVYSVFGDSGEVPATMALNVSFGVQMDKFYRNYNYTVWTLSFGLGEPPSDGVSMLVIIVIACGLGIPGLLMLAAVAYLCLRRAQGGPGGQPSAISAYEPINA